MMNMVDRTNEFLVDKHKKVVILCISIAGTKQAQLFLFFFFVVVVGCLCLCGSYSTSWEQKKKQCHRFIQKGREKSMMIVLLLLLKLALKTDK